MIFCEISYSLDIGTIVLAGLFFLLIIVFLIVKKCKKTNGEKRNDYVLDGIDFSLSPNCHFSLDNSDRQILYKVWVDITTRTLGVKIDFEKDNIKAVNDSYHSCFVSTRELLKEIPIHKLEDNKDIVNLLTYFLNNLLRPYLTKWGIAYAEWYESVKQKSESNNRNSVLKSKSFIELQKSFPSYKELKNDLEELNNKIIDFSNKIYGVVFKDKV